MPKKTYVIRNGELVEKVKPSSQLVIEPLYGSCSSTPLDLIHRYNDLTRRQIIEHFSGTFS